MKNFQKSLRAKVIAGIILAFYFVGVGVYYNWRAVSHHGIYNLISGVLALIIMTTIPALIFINTLRWRLILTDSGIMIRSMIKSRMLGYSEIKGYALTAKSILIIPKDDSENTITLSNSFENADEFIDWLKTKYQEIETETVKEDGSDADASGTAQDDRIAQAKNWVYSVHAVSILIVILTVCERDTYPAIAILCSFIPFAYFAVYYYYDDVVRIAPDRDSPYPSVGLAMMMSSFALMTPLVSIHYTDSSQFYLYSFYAMLLFLVIYLGRYYRSSTAMKSQLILNCFFLVVAGGLYGYNLSSWINKFYDQSPPQTYYASVMDKYLSHGKSTYYHVALSPWGPLMRLSNIDVTKETYGSYEIGDRVEISLHNGALGIPWYVFNKEKDE